MTRLGVTGSRDWLPAWTALFVAALLLFSRQALTQSDGDLFAHIAFGRVILERGLPAEVSPAWGSAVLFALLDRWGGLTMVSMAVALIAGIAHALQTGLLLRSGTHTTTTLLAVTVGFALAASHWLARPHAFTLLGCAALMTLLRSPGMAARAALGPLFAVWANLHGGWVFGWLVVVVDGIGKGITAAQRAEWRVRIGREAGTLLLVTAATFATPYGLSLHRAVSRALRDVALSGVIDEYRPPTWSATEDWLFFVTAAFVVAVAVRQPRRLTASVLPVLALSLAAAMSAGRNISLFAFTGWPLFVAAFTAPETAGDDAPWPIRIGSVLPTMTVLFTATVLLALGSRDVVQRRIIPTPVDSTRFPTAAVQRLHRDNVSGPLMTTWAWSGYVSYAWPGRRAWFDPLAFSVQEMQRFGDVLLVRRAPSPLLDSLGIEIVMIPHDIPLARQLTTLRGWRRWYADGTTIVFRRERRSALSDPSLRARAAAPHRE